MPRKIIKLEIGHSSVRMSERYTHFTREQRKAAAEKLAVSLSQDSPKEC